MFVLIALAAAAAVLRLAMPAGRKSLKNKHVVVTGGSSGIGKSVAKLAAREGAHVTIIARNVERLEEAYQEIKAACIAPDQIVTKVSVDVSNPEAVENNLCEVETTVCPIYMLVNCAGISICGEVEDLTLADIRTLINVNYLGTLYPIRAIIPKFKKRREGIVVLTSSQAGLTGMFGLGVYSSMKFALRGLAESLHQELMPYGIGVTLALPADTDTPGFEIENRSKPVETKLMSEAAGLFQPDDVARQMLDDALAGRFFSYKGFESFVLTTLCVGMSPMISFFDVLVQVLILGPLRAVSCYYINTFNKIILKCHREKNAVREKAD